MQVLLSILCMALTSAVIGNAYIQKKQFYPAVVYITKSNASMAVIYIQFFMIVFMFGKLLRKIFLGTLRAAEFEHLLERFWYALTETCLAFTVFRDDFNPRFVALFTVLLFLKSFHWLAEERVDFMERSPVLGWLFHIRVASLLFVLGVLDYLLLSYAHEATVLRGPTVQLVFGFEYAILLTVVLSTLIKYVLHSAEMRTDTPWENKAVFLLYTELVIGLIKVILYVLFVFIMAKIYALPMFVFRPMFFTIRNFKRALSDVIMSRRAIRNMNTLYPDATAEELRLSDNICIICREDMVSHSKKLPCGHIFHTTCLRSWFQRQQTCPTCRLNILRSPAANSTAIRRPEEAAAPAVAAGAGVPAATAQPTGAATVATAASNVGNPDAASRAEAPLGVNPFENLSAGPFANLLGAGVPPGSVMPPPPPGPFMFPPAFPFMGPHTVPPPPMPPDLTTFTDEELRAMEGNERSHVEQRIKLLRNIQTFLDAASILMTNYQIVSAQPVTSNQPPASAPPVSAAATQPAAVNTSAAAPPPPPESPARDGPSTSAAAAAAAFAAFTQAKTSSSLLAEAGKTAATGSDTGGKKKFTSGDVTIEDLGREENEDKVISVAAAATTGSSSTSDVNITTIDGSDEVCELRKRRLKYLEERNQTTAAATTSATSGESSLQ